jgi:hypothetical protein
MVQMGVIPWSTLAASAALALAAATPPETNVQLWGCDGRPTQRWRLVGERLQLVGTALVLGNSTLPGSWLQTGSMAIPESRNLVAASPRPGAPVQGWLYNRSTAQLVSTLPIPLPNGTGQWDPKPNVLAFSTGQVCVGPSMTQYIGGWEYQPQIPGSIPGTYDEKSLWGANLGMVRRLR